MMGWFVFGLILGLLVGAGVTLAVCHLRGRSADRQMREAFTTLASEALDANSRRLAEQAGGVLDGKKQLIDQSVAAVNDRLTRLGDFLQRLEAERKQDLGRLSSSVGSLAATTGELHKMLASTQRRGAWGERMAEDVLRLAGLAEGVNYTKQSAAEAESGRPDFTFFLPSDLKVNMDVKFPLESYKAYVDAETDDARAAALRQLTTAVRGHIKAVATRGYIDPKAPTVDYVLLFIPSEQIYSLVLEAQRDLLDEALRQKIVLASPLTLYAMLAVIRQAAENANLTRTADEVITLLGQFNKQWQAYKEQLGKLGRALETTTRAYEDLNTTRANQLQRPLDKIEDLRQSRNLPEE